MYYEIVFSKDYFIFNNNDVILLCRMSLYVVLLWKIEYQIFDYYLLFILDQYLLSQTL